VGVTPRSCTITKNKQILKITKHIKTLMMTTDTTQPRIPHGKSGVVAARVARWVKGGKSELRALSLSSFNAVEALDDLRLLLNSSLELRLHAKELFDSSSVEKSVKKFCGELLDHCKTNHWRDHLLQAHVCLRTRVNVSASLFSLRKILPSPKPNCSAYVKSMKVPSPPPTLEFLTHCSRIVREEFPSGWDRSYWNEVKNFTPPTKSNLSKRTSGSYREFVSSNGRASWASYKRWANGTVTSPIPGRVRCTAVEAGGKWRVISLSHRTSSHMLPVHRALYSFMSKKNWLLRGEATPVSFSSFRRFEGGVFVSGDYESASDNLNVNVSRHVLNQLFSSATHIPIRVREECLAFLQPDFEDLDSNVIGTLGRGQLMGSPLCFPLLCLINYITFRFAGFGPETPVKINGDDIVFYCDRSRVQRWFDCVSQSGLVVSRSKTMVASNVFSLNSTYFGCRRTGVPYLFPHFRVSNIFKKCDSVVALVGRIKQVGRDLPGVENRIRALRVLLRKNLTQVYSGQGSFCRRYSCRLPLRAIRDVGLFERESFYTRLPCEPPVPKKFEKWWQVVVPTSWSKRVFVSRGEEKVPEEELSSTFVEGAWTSPIQVQTRDEYWARVRDQSFRYVQFSPRAEFLYRRFVGRSYCPSRPLDLYDPREKFWTRKEEIEGSRSEPVAFRCGGFQVGS